MDSINIQRMTANEVEAVANLWLGLIGEHAVCDRSYFADYRGNHKRKIQLLEATLRDPLEQVWLALVDDELVGFCSVYVSYVTGMYNTHIEATLGDIYVLPDYRSAGIGKLLLEEAVQWSKIREANKLRLSVHSENKDAINYYRKIGFIEKFKVMMLDLG